MIRRLNTEGRDSGAMRGSRMLRQVVHVLGMSVVLVTCAQAKSEWFSVGMTSYASKPKLVSARLESEEKGLKFIGPASRILYSHGDNLRVPEKITLVWTAAGEQVEHRALFTLRAHIPARVFKLIASRKRPPHSLWLDFRVIAGRPECGWKLDRIGGEGAGATELEGGVVAGEILP
jgi:hypothetical protein